MANELGSIRGAIILDVNEAINAYTKVRQEHLSAVSALNSGAGAIQAVSAGFLAAGTGMAAGIMLAVGAAAEFERKLDFFTAVSGATQKEYDKIRAKALQLGADTIYSADQIADSFVELAKTGVTTTEILNGIGDAVANLGAATDMPLTDAAVGLTTVLNTFRLGAEDAVAVVDKLAGAANSSAIDVNDLILTLSYAGASAATAGIAFEDVNTAIALLGERGIRGSKAGTGLRQMFDKLIAPTNKGKDALAALGIVLEDGTNQLLNAQGGLKPIPQLLDMLNGALAPLSTNEKMDILGQIFPITSLPTILNLLDGGSEGLARLNAEITKTTALDIASERLDNLSGDLEILRGNLQTLVINIGATQQALARDLVQAVTSVVNWLNQLDDRTLGLITTMAGITSIILIVVGLMGLMSGAILNIMALTLRLAPAIGFLAAQIRNLWFWTKLLVAVFIPKPLLIIIAVVSALAAALTYFFTQTETGQAVWSKLMAAIQQGIALVMPHVTTFLQMVGTFLVNAFNQLMPILAQVAAVLMGVFSTAVQTLSSVFQSIMPAIQAFLGILMDVVTTILGVLAPVFETAGESVGTLAEAYAPLIAMFIGQLLPVIGELVQAWQQVVTSLVPLVLLLMGQVIPAFTMLLTMIIPPLIQLVMTLVPIIIQLVQTFVQLGLQLLGVLLPILIQFIGAILPVIISLFEAIVPVIMAVVTAIIPLITTIAEMLIPTIQFLMEVITVVFAAIAPIIEAALSIVVAIIQTVTALIKGDWEGVWNGILGILRGVWNLIASVVTAAVNIVMGIIKSAVTWISTFWNTAWKNITQWFADAWKNITNGLQNAASNIRGFFDRLPGMISAALAGIGSWLLGAGRDLINGLVRGIQNAGKAVMNAIGGVVNGAINWAKGLLGIKSPSRVFKDIGVNTIMGMVVGMEKTAPKLEQQFNMLSDSLDSFYDQVYAAREMEVMMNLKSQMDPLGFGLTGQMANLTDLMTEIANKDTIVIEHQDINNPEPEPTSESLPNAIRKSAYLVG